MSENLKAKLLAIKTEIGKVYKDASNSGLKFKYATLSNILNKVNSLLDKHQVLMTISIQMNSELTSITNKLIYSGTVEFLDVTGNEFKEYHFNFPSDTQQKNDIQAFGSTMTYAQRYMLGAIFGIAFDDEDPDNDKNTVKNEPKQTTYQSNTKVSNGNLISEAQSKRLYAITKSKDLSKETVLSILSKYGYNTSKEIEMKNYESICKDIENA